MKEHIYQLAMLLAADEPEDLEFLMSRLDIIGRYVQSVFKMESQMPLYRMMLSGEKLREKNKELDSSRHVAHDAAIAAVKQLNRLFVSYDLPEIYKGDVGDRRQVADFCMELVKDYYDKRYSVRK